MADLNNDFDKFVNCCIVMSLGTITAASLGKFFQEGLLSFRQNSLMFSFLFI